ncbi:MAG: CoA ester lyase [Pseudohongiellaceae bacterium]
MTHSRDPQPGPKGHRRSLHFVPGGNERMFARALDLAADSLILDLEDAVTPEYKERARDAVCEWLRDNDFGGKECLVRINPQDSPWGRADLEAVVACRPDGLMLPKVVTRGNVDAIDQIVGSLESEQGMTAGAISLVLIGAELPEAVFNLPALARNPRVDAVTWGAEDLGAILGAHAKRDADGNYLEVFSYVRATCLLAAAAAEAQAVDAVYVDFSDTKGLEKEALTAAAMGFRGKLTIHPDQVDIVNAAFTPGEAAVAEAQALIEAFEAQQAGGHMAFSFNGRMVDVPHLKKARELLALAARISGQTS